MLAAVRSTKVNGKWSVGCTSEDVQPIAVGHAGPAEARETPHTGRTNAGQSKPPGIAFEPVGKIRELAKTERLSGPAKVTPITAGSAGTKEFRGPEENYMPATAAATAPAIAPSRTTPAPRRGKAIDRTRASRTAANRHAKRDRIVLENLPLVKAIAVRVHENLPVHVDLDDLVHAGVLGLFDAATKYDPDKMVSFSSYAKHRIKGAILDSLRQLDWASRDLRRRHKQLEAATRELAGELHRMPSEAEIAQRMGVDVDRWRQMMIDLRNVGLVSASQRPAEQDELPAPDFPAAPELQPDRMCSQQQLRSALGEAMKCLPERYQKVVALYYTNEMTMKEIGGMLGINESRVSQIHKTALEKMANVMKEAGIYSSAAF